MKIGVDNLLLAMVLSLLAHIMDINTGNNVILLVEDNPILRFALEEKLRANKFPVISTHSGEKAIQLAHENWEIRIAVMDIDLGRGINGIETARIITQIDKKIDIIFFTSQDQHALQKELDGLQFHSFLPKKNNLSELEGTIKNILNIPNQPD